MTHKSRIFDFRDESKVLRASIAATLTVAVVGIILGLASGSFSIMFEGIYAIVDAGMSLLSLVVVNLITAYAQSTDLPPRLRERFTMGFWHLEPIVLAMNGLMLIGVATYALFNAISSLLEGGRELQFGLAILYAGITLAICATVAAIETRANRLIGSDFIRLDVRSWVMSGCIAAALLVAFGLGIAVQGTQFQWVSPYIDPAALALICLVVIPLPITSVRRALSDILLVTPADLKQRVDEVCARFVAEQDFLTYRAYVAKVGRSHNIEVYFILKPGGPPRAMAKWDALRDEIGEAIGGDGPHQWLTIVFTEDLEWA
ncbi:cation diffusion facilitator family transporter [Altererythrobacter sp. Root672]|uniref:cation diffusion facilitator family transporter n=1 Tax=Altererythrobacter sp. Root672 TaxID=1736584 RepID=UPI0006FE6B6B|nr:cation transporter [Altererythrobacter sp. Root672]KRA82685.1 cation diffusion facilitator family transporter [Altererythrobacter sp. Root672]